MGVQLRIEESVCIIVMPSCIFLSLPFAHEIDWRDMVDEVVDQHARQLFNIEFL
jgi:hypothetical protein